MQLKRSVVIACSNQNPVRNSGWYVRTYVGELEFFVVVFFSHDEKAVKTTGYVSQFTLHRREVDKIKSMTCVLGGLETGSGTVSRDTS